MIRLHLHALPEIHEGFVDLACLSQGLASRLCVPRTLRSGQVDDGERAARPWTFALQIPLLDFHAKEAVTPGADGIASCTGDLALHQPRLEHHEGFFQASADDFRKTCYHLAVGALFRALEQESPALEVGDLALCRGSGQKIEDTIIVDLVHGYDDGIFGGFIYRKVDIVDAG